MKTYVQGEDAHISLTFTDDAGRPVEITDLVISVWKPDGTSTDYSGISIDSPSDGVYTLDVTTDQAGIWRYADTSAISRTAHEGAFLVRGVPSSALLSLDDLPSVRAALDVTLDDTTLPDGVLLDPIFFRRAERAILALLPNAADRTGEEHEVVRDATVLLLASLVAPALPALLSEHGADYDYRRAQVDWTAVAARLRTEAMALLDPLVEAPLPSVGPPTRFTVAHRARHWAPSGWWG